MTRPDLNPRHLDFGHLMIWTFVRGGGV